MKLALIGATGFVGSALLTEALARGHSVTALARTPSKLAARPGLTVVQADVLDADQVAKAVAGHDAVLSAYNPGWQEPKLYDVFLQGSKAITAGVKRAGMQRLLVVGGAGSLFVAPGVQLVDTPQFPAEWKVGATAARDALNLLRDEPSLQWTFLSPSAHLEPGGKQGGYRIGADELLMKDGAPAHISVGDLAAALIDEAETPKHVRQRFTVGY
jgi:uncharacterized protein